MKNKQPKKINRTFKTVLFVAALAVAALPIFGQYDSRRALRRGFDSPAERRFENANASRAKNTSEPDAQNKPSAAGDLDPTFGAGGKVITDFSEDAFYPRQVEVQSDGKIVALGWLLDANGNPIRSYLIRYNPNGAVDNSFGTNGRVYDTDDRIFEDGFVAQPDGKLLVAGDFYEVGSGNDNFAVFRLNPNGTYDTSWGTNGAVPIPIVAGNSFGHEILVQPDGKIVVFGAARRGASNDFDIGIARLNTNGTLDNSFGTNGVSVVQIPNSAAFTRIPEVWLQADGKFLFLYQNSNAALAGVVRVNANGTLDTSFAAGGLLVAETLTWNVRALALQPDGKFILVTRNNNNEIGQSIVSRYNSNGTLDTAFGTNGRVVFSAQSPTDFLTFRAVVVQPNGKIVIGGAKSTSSEFNFMLLRLNPNGAVDASFGTNGIVTTVMSQYGGAIASMALQPDGKLIVFGYVLDANDFADIGLARYLLDAVRPARFDFDGDGKADQAVFRPSDRVWYLLRSSSGPSAAQFGNSTDKLAPADFDGDGRTDIAVFRDGIWYWLASSNGSFNAYQFGLAGDIPVPADYTGDGRAEIAVYRSGVWYLLNLVNNQFRAVRFGIASDKPVPADYDGDGKIDAAVFRDGVWYWLRSSDNGFRAVQFGVASDKPTVGDYDGDSKADQAVYRSGVWYILGSAQGFYAVQFGISSDVPVAADYDGDAKTDIAVYRDRVWYLLRSQQGFGAVQFGEASDRPIPAAFVP